ncbi:aldehyde dehydrogenase family protein [Haloglycomyces albus]|uniref:aldehyde dehydrogenase family protein n=1 Tax=Haloglycomyces albus TaxID=526067 RepID=UPI00046D0B7F|nr:aldehyde dehydrogenase family protein [Haloglycomyces albus]
MNTRLNTLKTYKMYVGGKFPRSESGRTYAVTTPEGDHLANAPHATRKDVRDAVAKARAAQSAWADATAYLRGQMLYRAAEMMEGRFEQYVDELVDAQGLDRDDASDVVADSIDRLIHYAGWTDKIDAVLSSNNTVAGSFSNVTSVETRGVIGLIAPQDDPLYGFIDAVGAAIVSGNTVVAVTSHRHPLPALSLGEVFATSDIPGGVVNILSADAAEVGSWLASHDDVDGVDLTGVSDRELAAELETKAANSLRVVRRPGADSSDSLDRIRTWVQYKTVWQPSAI